ncbi:hypothetical protein AMTRI_Chr09g12260 [Amborella trichopoda]
MYPPSSYYCIKPWPLQFSISPECRVDFKGFSSWSFRGSRNPLQDLNHRIKAQAFASMLKKPETSHPRLPITPLLSVHTSPLVKARPNSEESKVVGVYQSLGVKLELRIRTSESGGYGASASSPVDGHPPPLSLPLFWITIVKKLL